ncbi:uncharacterized protein LOC119598400 [Penaeus monodon]|uniref:uncharacterized protein LOC119598400 n=1 Tax=Penaeus monodon TaxID=6687 RepID=UPI0018A75E58|nr:uncharacterized protein LOC119598400 [Penaeus monodon]
MTPEAKICMVQHLQRQRTGFDPALPVKSPKVSDISKQATELSTSRRGVLHTSTSTYFLLLCSTLWVDFEIRHLFHFAALGQLFGTSIYHTTAYNPEANGMVERFHRTLKAALMFQCSNSMWFSQLPWVLLGLERPQRKGSKSPPAEMRCFFPNAPSRTTTPDYDASSDSSTHPANRPTGHPNTVTSPKIYAQRNILCTEVHTPPLTLPYSGPYEVIDRKN